MCAYLITISCATFNFVSFFFKLNINKELRKSYIYLTLFRLCLSELYHLCGVSYSLKRIYSEEV